MRISRPRVSGVMFGLVLLAGTASVPVPVLAQPAKCGIQRKFNFKEPHAPMFDTIINDIPPSSVTYGIDGFLDITVNLGGLGPECDSQAHSIDFIHDQSQIPLNNVNGVGEYSDFKVLSWVEMIDSAKPNNVLRLWPNPTHLAPNPANDFPNCIVASNTSFSCWDHENIPRFYKPIFPVLVRHYTFVTYSLDFSDRQVDHYCDYQIDKAGNVTLANCTRNEGAFFK